MSSNESWAATPSFGSNLHRWGQKLWFLNSFAQSADWHSSKAPFRPFKKSLLVLTTQLTEMRNFSSVSHLRL